MGRRGGGPELPYDLVAGACPTSTGWILATAKVLGPTFAPETPRILASFADVIDDRPPIPILAISAPIGLATDLSGRTCDREARELVGGVCAPAIEDPPTLAMIEERSPIVSGALDHDELLLERYREVADEMAPFLQRRIYEVHPELSLYEMNDATPLASPSGSEAGDAERRSLLETRMPGIDLVLDTPLDRVDPRELLVVAACLWTARRIRSHVLIRIPDEPEWDSRELRVELVR